MATVHGAREIEAAFRRVAKQADRASRLIVVESAALVEAKAKSNFSGSHKRGEPHHGAAGGFPNVVTGTLRRSIRHSTVVRSGVGGYSTKVGPSAIYSRAVELQYGYAFFGPAVAEVRPMLAAVAAKHWRAAIVRR